MANGYEKTYALLRPRLAACDLARVAEPLGLAPPEGGEARLELLGRGYRADGTGVYPLDGLPDDVNARSVIVYYLTHGGSGEPGRDFRFLHHFSHGLFSGGGRDVGWMTAEARAALGDREKFARAAAALGARFERDSGDGAYTWLLPALPKVPALVTYVEADEEFPLEIQIKFDATAIRFLPFETLAVLNGLIARQLIL